MSANSQTHIDDASKCLNSPFLEVFPVVIISKGMGHTLFAVAYQKNLQRVFFRLGISQQNSKRRGGEHLNVSSNAMKKPRLDDITKYVER